MIGPKIKIGIILALIAGLSSIAWLYREIKQSAQLAHTVIQQRTTLDEMEAQLMEARRWREHAETVAAKYKQRVDTVRKEARSLRDEVNRLEKEDEEVRHWAGNDLPGPVVDLCRMRHDKDGGQD